MEMVLLLELLPPCNGTHSARRIKFCSFSWCEVLFAEQQWRSLSTKTTWQHRNVLLRTTLTATVSLTTAELLKVCPLSHRNEASKFQGGLVTLWCQCAISLAFMTSSLTKAFSYDVLKRLITEWWFNCVMLVITVWRNVIFHRAF